MKRRVLIFGTFDGIHEGHRDMFRQARACGDRLVVILARDVTVERVKGRLPFRNEQERFRDVKDESLVDEIILGDLNDARVPLRTLRPDVICLGYDQSAFVEILQEKEFSGIRVVRLKPFRPDEYKSSIVAKHLMRERILSLLQGIRTEAREVISKRLLEKVSEHTAVVSSQTILGYSPISCEVDPTPLYSKWRTEGRTILFPFVRGTDIVPVLWEEDVPCSRCPQGFPVLEGNVKEWKDPIDMVLVPAVAVDREGWRLGRGGGYYDRFLTSHEIDVTMSVVYPEQVVDRVPREHHDQKIDIIIT